ncbi:DUF6380 family protein [Streptomyces sp. NPDC001165]|uniref:DUF6380 family protein n=1 Tax=Streptomyces sp. NPDC001165 TaxID=3364546 RepID=UPI003678F71D
MDSVDEADSDGPMRRATFRCGVASLLATAGRAPFTLYAEPVCSAPKGRGAVPDMRLPPRGRDQPRRSRKRSTALPAERVAWKDAR